jgi:hypothetical protein
MTGKQRLGMLAVAVIVAVAAFVIVKPGDDEDEGGGTPAAETAPANGASNEDATAEAAPPPPAPTVHIVRLDAFAPRGGVQDFQAEKGETVRIMVTSDAADEIHLHGYDVYREVAPGKPARFRFKADIEGIFEIESHEAEHAGKDALIAKLTVRPS